MSSRSIFIDISIRSSNELKKCQLTGYAYLDSGFLAGRINPIEGNINNEEYLLLSGFTFTGCPIAARTIEAGINPWVWTNGSYHANRIMTTKQFQVCSQIEAVGTDEKINMLLSVDISGELPKFISVGRTFQERIEQKIRNTLSGTFSIDFIDSNGNTFSALSLTDYHLEANRDVDPVWRNITIIDSATINSILQIEQIDLFSSEKAANDDLEEKQQASAALLPKFQQVH